jgi:hypothetical protein
MKNIAQLEAYTCTMLDEDLTSSMATSSKPHGLLKAEGK